MQWLRQIIRRVPLKAFRNLVLIELASVFIYLVVGFLAYYAQIYRSLPIAKLISFQIAQVVFVFGAQTIILMFVFYRWSHVNLKGFKPMPTVHQLLEGGENKDVEFKSSLRWDFRENKVNRSLEKSVMKTVAAFLNTEGGHLIIGVDDKKNITGIRKDLATLRKPDLDGFENHFNNIFSEMIGPSLRQYVGLVYANTGTGDSHCCIVNVSPSSNPAYLNTDNNEEFYIRTGNGTTALKLSEAYRYIKNRF